MAFKAKIIGIPHIPTITQVNIRAEPTKTANLMFKVDVGISNLTVTDVKPDAANDAQAGKVFQWFKLTFPDGQQGWCRDDLIEVQGDGKSFGYGQVATPTVGFVLTRQQAPAAPPPAIPISTAPEPTTPAPSVAASQDEKTGPGMVVCMMKGGANVRPGPGVATGGALFRMNYLNEATILGIDSSRDANDPFKWLNIDFQGQKGWVREDLIRLKGDFEQHGIAFNDMYPSPVPDSWWVRDFYMDTNFNSVIHWGWDHGGNLGVPVLSGPMGGVVIKAAFCQKCGPNGVSAVDKGYPVSDSRVLSDPNWNYGYGHFVNVTYHHDKLPKSTQDRLAAQGKTGWHISVNYAHLQSIDVQPGQQLAPNTQIGKLGNSGNSQGPHLHLEVRAHQDGNLTDWARMKSGLMSPSILYLR